MGKRNIISKLNIKDFSKNLEEILAKKPFSKDTKNILLSMLYKMENAYPDYKKVKVNVQAKKDILSNLMQLIEDCNQIEIVEPQKEKEDLKKNIVMKDEKKIIAFPNETAILYALHKLGSNKYKGLAKYEIVGPSVNQLLDIGKAMDISEIIRDFDGWSWNINRANIENVFANFIYQSMKLSINIDEIENVDLIKGMKSKLKIFSKEDEIVAFLRLFFALTIIYNIEDNVDEKERLIEFEKCKKQELTIILNKTTYLKGLNKRKEEVDQKIADVNKLLNNDKVLKEKYIKINQKLDQKDRIFSLSDFSEIQEQERDSLLKELEEIKDKQNPNNYIREKLKVENELNFLEEINLKNTSKTKQTFIIAFIKSVIEGLENELKVAETKKQIIDLLYKIRYYRKLPVDEIKSVEDIAETKKVLQTFEKNVITEACNLKILNIISQNVVENYKIVSKILNIGIIDLESIYISCKLENDKTIFNIYEEKSLEKAIGFSNIKDLNIKTNKKIKLFI